MAKKIYIIEDEADILNLLKFIITEDGQEVYGFSRGKNALEIINKIKPDLILLDIMLPDMSGLEICKILKSSPSTWSIPLIILSSRSDEYDIITGHSLGCDDYMTKPFSKNILLAKIKTALKREERKITDAIKIHDLLIDKERKEVSIKGKFLRLTAQEFKILSYLALKKGQVLSRNQIINAIKEGYDDTSDRVIDVSISKIRKKLGSHGKHLKSVYGMGYKFNDSNN